MLASFGTQKHLSGDVLQFLNMSRISTFYSESNQSNTGDIGFIPGVTSKGQSFISLGGTLDKSVFYIRKNGSPTGNITSTIYAHSGTFGTSSVPTGASLAVSDSVDASTVPTSSTLVSFVFSGANKISLTSGTSYVVTIDYSNGSAINNISVGQDATSPTYNGNSCNYNGTSWSAVSGTDLSFYVYLDGSNGFSLFF